MRFSDRWQVIGLASFLKVYFHKIRYSTLPQSTIEKLRLDVDVSADRVVV